MLKIYFHSIRCVTTIFVSTGSFWTKNLARRCAGRGQQLRKRPNAACAQMAQLPPVSFLDWIIKPCQEFESIRSDAGPYHSPVFGLAGARDQATFFQAVKQSGHVGVARNHAAGNLTAR